jgi:hypothetical protein
LPHVTSVMQPSVMQLSVTSRRCGRRVVMTPVRGVLGLDVRGDESGRGRPGADDVDLGWARGEGPELLDEPVPRPLHAQALGTPRRGQQVVGALSVKRASSWRRTR